MISPFIALLPFFDRNLPQKFLVLKGGPNWDEGYNTIQQAEADGAITMAYGYVTFSPIEVALKLMSLPTVDSLIRLSTSSPLVLFFTHSQGFTPS